MVLPELLRRQDQDEPRGAVLPWKRTSVSGSLRIRLSCSSILYLLRWRICTIRYYLYHDSAV